MRKRIALVSLTCAVAGVVALISPSPSGAAQPASTVVQVNTTFVNTFDCPFPLVESVVGAYKDTVYFDAHGIPTKEVLTAQFGGPLKVTWTNPADGATLSSNESAPLIVRYNPDGSFAGLQNVGLVFHVSIPGQGTVLLDVGRVVIVSHQGVTFEAGQHQELNGDTGEFCAALA